MIKYSANEIAKMCDTWQNYNGFTGEVCGKCKKTANVFALGAGWFCDCGHYNVQSFFSSQGLYGNPDMGTPANVILEGHRNSKKHSAED
jgi:hypothetical protein